MLNKVLTKKVPSTLMSTITMPLFPFMEKRGSESLWMKLFHFPFVRIGKQNGERSNKYE